MADHPAAFDLDDVVRRADPARWLATRFIADVEARVDVIALYAFDHELARAPKVASNALIAEVRLTWWREALDEIYAGGRVRGHPVAQALCGAVRGRGLPRALLETMIDARIDVLDRPRLELSDARAWADGVSGATTRLAVQVLDAHADAANASDAGRLWGMALLARSGLLEPGVAQVEVGPLRQAARASAKRLSSAAFPAVAHVVLANIDPLKRPLESRACLTWAVATGRL